MFLFYRWQLEQPGVVLFYRWQLEQPGVVLFYRWQLDQPGVLMMLFCSTPNSWTSWMSLKQPDVLMMLFCSASAAGPAGCSDDVVLFYSWNSRMI